MTKRSRSRTAPYPNSILDRAALTTKLEDLGLYPTKIKTMHLDTLFQSLHRLHYPDLPEFVRLYYYYQSGARHTDSRPLKNSISKHRNPIKQNLPQCLLDFLRTTPDFITLTSTVARAKTSADASTTKLAVRLFDGQLVESVIMRYTRTMTSSRASLCVSSQCGCAMGCTFCATGQMGLAGNLTSAEILEQVVHADRILSEEHDPESQFNIELVRNVVFMGMGEPLDNYKNVVQACRALIDPKRWNLAHGRVTVSTVGIISKIRKLTEELPEVSLALSLHAPNQEMRAQIVPTAKHFPIQSLIDALDAHMMAYLHRRKRFDGTVEFSKEERIRESTRRRAMIEYVMLEGPTSTIEAAHQLGKLCENRHLVVNLIPYNQTDVKDQLRCPSTEHLEVFRQIVASYGTFCTIRRTMGADIDSACGQLITTSKDIEDTARAVVKGDPPQPKVVRVKAQSWINFLGVATTIAASCFVVSAALFVRQRRVGR